MRRIDCDNKILQALSLYADLMLLSALWLLTSLPLVTAGASTAALYGVLLKLASGRDETGVVRAFFRRWRVEWRRGTLLWGCLLGVSALAGADLCICAAKGPGGALGSLMWTGSLLALLLALVLAVYVFALSAQFTCTVSQTFANAIRLAVRGPLWTLLLVALLAASAASVLALGFFSVMVLGVLQYQSARILYRQFAPAIAAYAPPEGPPIDTEGGVP